MAENPKQYFIDDETLAQGCQELTGTEDNVLILNFWRHYLEEKGVVEFHDEPEEVH